MTFHIFRRVCQSFFTAKLKPPIVISKKTVGSNFLSPTRSLYISSRRLQNKYGSKIAASSLNEQVPPVWQEFENEHAHRVLETLPHYKHLVKSVPGNVNQHLNVPSEIVDLLRSYESEPNPADSCLAPQEMINVLDGIVKLDLDSVVFRYEPFLIFVESLNESLKNFSESQFLECVCLLVKLSFRDFTEGRLSVLRYLLGKAVFVEIEKYACEWDKNTIFSVLEFFYQYRYKYIPHQLFQKLEEYVDDMTKEDIVYFLYYINLARHARLRLRQILERKVEEYIHDMNVDEVAIACLGFYKSRHVITSNTIVEVCLTKLCQNTNEIQEITVAAILKAVYGATNRNVDPFSSQVKSYSLGLLTAFLPRMSEFSITTCLHLLQISLTMKQLNHGILLALCEKVTNEDLSSWRLKDLSWLVLQLGLFQAKTSEKDVFYRKLVNEFLRPGRQAEPAYRRYPQCAVRALIGLSYLEIYPSDLINQVFSPSYINLIKEMTSYDIRRDLFQLDQSIRIEHSDYDGFLMSDDLLSRIQKHENIKCLKLPHDKLLSQQTKRDKLLLDVQSQIELLFNGDMYADIQYTLPHIQTADVVLEVREDGSLVDLVDWQDTESPNPGHKRIVLLVAAPNNYHIYQSDYGFSRKLLGNYVMKRRQIQKLGYTVIEIPYYEWNKTRNRAAYLKNLLQPHMNLQYNSNVQ